MTLKGKDKHDQKKQLTEEVKQWIRENESEAQDSFATSAKEVIELLKKIETKLAPATK